MQIKAGILFLVCLLPVLCMGQGFTLVKAPNKHKNNQMHGRWATYYQPEGTVRQSKGRYKNGNEKGTWRYYDEQGKLAKKEKYRGDIIITTTYHPNGKKRSTGQARIEVTPTAVEYFYFGDWKYFTESGHLHKVKKYERGLVVSEQVL